MTELFEYPVKILLAFEFAIAGKTEFFNWLLNNGYPELAALSNAIRGNTKAIDWLINNRYQHFAAFDAASVDDDRALKWLEDNNHVFLANLALASRGNQEAIDQFKAAELDIFLRIAFRIKKFTDGQVFDYHKPPF